MLGDFLENSSGHPAVPTRPISDDLHSNERNMRCPLKQMQWNKQTNKQLVSKPIFDFTIVRKM
jgi:hypothetical protein